MAIKRYFLSKDNTITNAYKSNLITRGTGSNMGASDILETFVIQGQTSASLNASTAEQSRVLLQFDMQEVLSDITNGTVPSSSVEYRLKLFNAPHGDTTPLSYSLDLHMVNGAWTEGRGLDMDSYTDFGESNWEFARAGAAWNSTGSDYYAGDGFITSSFLTGGLEDYDVNIDFAVNKWRTGEYQNHGFVLKHTDPVISGTLGTFFTKKFFGRNSEFFLKRPYVEAKWNSSRQDNRGESIISSSLADASDNLNKLFLYNSIRGQMKDIPGLEHGSQYVLVNFYSASAGLPTGSPLLVVNSAGATVTNITGGLLVENGTNITGVYSCSFASTSSFDTVCDVWFSGSKQYFTGSFDPVQLNAGELTHEEEYITSVTNLKSTYFRTSKPTLRTFVRRKNWDPNIFTVATSDIKPEIVDKSYYRMYRTIDNMEVFPYGTGSSQETLMSYDVSGNYFDLDMNMLEPGYSYALKFTYYVNGKYKEQPETFKFKVEEE